MRAKAVAAAVVVASSLTVPLTAQAAPIPSVWPAPQQIQSTGADVPLPDDVLVVADSGADAATRQVVVDTLHDGGVQDVAVVEYGNERPASFVVRLGALGGNNIRSSGVTLPSGVPAEGYFLSVSPGKIVLGGADTDGTYHGAQTLWQLMGPSRVPSVQITDHPTMKVRGVVEGSYGDMWSHDDEMDQMEFYGRVKFNSFIYAPKDDPYHRDNWKQLYPAARRAELAELVASAAQNHVKFTYALAPGLSICYSGAADYTALTAKYKSLYDIGVRSFSLPLDDLQDKWNCTADQQKYGAVSDQHIAQAQVDLLNRVQREFLPTLPGVAALQTVPAEYWDTDDSPYKSTYRAGLDERVVMMWTGVGVTPTSIEVFEAADAERVWGRKPLVWDNYPCNDYDTAAGRLLLGPYAERKAGIDAHLTGITANPMNLPYASKVTVFGVADFTWNSAAFDPQRSVRQYAEWLGGGDTATVASLQAFFDLNHLAPVLDEPGESWLDQAPELARRIAAFRTTWRNGDHHEAIDALWDYAEVLDRAPQLIRTNITDDGFARDTDPWLRASALWSEALLTALNGLASRVDGDDEAAADRFAETAALVRRAEDVPSTTRFDGKVKLGDGVLDTFLEEAADLRP
ncbi:beta-N-acetylglucosaminidase domain-containing protein [Lentzea sp. JNUCC 0626]|uniref:beta-N-acetylglucosaminidase domain-containing protein n=1 Tax=Lentzea sp. JNUCC 0626 TaxID=3367513 RepID=UPI0037483AEF